MIETCLWASWGGGGWKRWQSTLVNADRVLRWDLSVHQKVGSLNVYSLVIDTVVCRVVTAPPTTLVCDIFGSGWVLWGVKMLCSDKDMNNLGAWHSALTWARQVYLNIDFNSPQTPRLNIFSASFLNFLFHRYIFQGHKCATLRDTHHHMLCQLRSGQ